MIVILKYMTVAPVCSLNLPRLDMILFLDLLSSAVSFRIFDNYSIKWDWVWCEQLCIEDNVIHRGRGGGGRGFCPGLWEVKWGESGHKRNAASYPDVSLSLSLDENVRAKDRGKETTGETALRLPSVPSPWSLAVHHQSLAFRARLYDAKYEAPEEEVERNG